MSEKKKVVISHIAQEVESNTYLRYFSNLRKVIRMIAWMRRWKTYKRGEQRRKELSLVEEQEAENCLWRMVQQESFGNSKKLSTQLNAEKDEFGLWRVKTKLLLRSDTEGFRRPILLPKEHIAVFRLVQKEHLDMRHCDNQVLRSTLRERFWIIGSRIVTRQVVTGCKRCIRFKAKNLTTPVASLPSNRVKDAAVFEVTGIDLGGPLYLLDEKKAWFVIFTCAVYRAVHLELVSSLSTEGFIQALRRFIARRGRPEVIYTDNGTNFVGTENLMEKLNWEEIVSHTEVRRIKWIFNPPSAPWWGGWWERIVAMIKQLLRRNLGRGVLDYEEMSTVLCDCEQLLNLRPLTYLSEDPEELREITPMMFLNEARSSEVIDLDKIESNAFGERFKHRQEIRQELRERFRKDYLSLLVHRNIRNKGHTSIKVGDVVIMEVENKKRINWPLARVTQTFPGSDGVVRSVKVRVVKGGKRAEFERPIQRLYMLESTIEDIKDIALPDKMTEQGKNLKGKPIEYGGEGKNITRSGQTVQQSSTEDIRDLTSPIKITDQRDEEKPIEYKAKKDEEKKITRSGRTVQQPKRFGF